MNNTIETIPQMDFISKLMYVIGDFYHSSVHNTLSEIDKNIENSSAVKYIGELNKQDLMY